MKGTSNVVGRPEFELQWSKPKYLKLWPQDRYILRFHIFWNLQYLLSKLLEGYDVKTVFSCNNGLFKLLLYTNALPRFLNFNSIFLKINFH